MLKRRYNMFLQCEVMHWNDILVYINTELYFRDINNHLFHYTFVFTGEIKTKSLHLYQLMIYCGVSRYHVIDKNYINQT